MKTYLMADSVRYRSMSARELRATFLLDTLDAPGEIRLAYLETDRAVVGMASPVNSALALAVRLRIARAVLPGAARSGSAQHRRPGNHSRGRTGIRPE